MVRTLRISLVPLTWDFIRLFPGLINLNMLEIMITAEDISLFAQLLDLLPNPLQDLSLVLCYEFPLKDLIKMLQERLSKPVFSDLKSLEIMESEISGLVEGSVSESEEGEMFLKVCKERGIVLEINFAVV